MIERSTNYFHELTATSESRRVIIIAVLYCTENNCDFVEPGKDSRPLPMVGDDLLSGHTEDMRLETQTDDMGEHSAH